jgi:hypothetical protein
MPMNARYEEQALADAQAHRFDPYHLRPLASLNRRRLIALPGLDEADVGRSGWELLSKAALVKLIQPHVRGVPGRRQGDTEGNSERAFGVPFGTT